MCWRMLSPSQKVSCTTWSLGRTPAVQRLRCGPPVCGDCCPRCRSHHTLLSLQAYRDLIRMLRHTHEAAVSETAHGFVVHTASIAASP